MKRLLTKTAGSALALAMLAGGLNAAADIETGTTVSNLTVTDTYGVAHNLADFAGQNVVLEWTNAECPFVKKHYDSDNMQMLQRGAKEAGDTVWLTVTSSGLQGIPLISADDANTLTAERGAEPTAYILDPEGEAGMAFGAKATPHMFVIDAAQTLVYQGAIDDQPTTLGEVSEAHNYVTAALASVRAGTEIEVAQTQAYGCPVKYGPDDGSHPPRGPRPDGPPPGDRPDGPPPGPRPDGPPPSETPT